MTNAVNDMVSVDNDVLDGLETESEMVSIHGMGKKIREARQACGLSQYKAAAYCGVAGLTFQRWEYDCTKAIRRDSYMKLLDILNGTVVMEDA